MYVADPRFTAVYDQHAESAAEFVRDALKAYVERHLTGLRPGPSPQRMWARAPATRSRTACRR
ncbi:TipAS antibiotic-recognition domain-containing protein [Streptomyces sp. NPDC002730]|uniref:TipAS antibiotic-recognition domain-containing protein n=1 Tax=Streptomyces sp. NPDC002730 TaxID=3364662 RepID=UPI003682A98D